MSATVEPGASPGLHRGLRPRQISMMALGGVIGAGLFVGSGNAIRAAGPGVLVAYAAVGLLVVLIMRMLAEMAVASPEPGTFASYATREFGSWAGMAVGYIYAYMWIVAIGFEATAAAKLFHGIVPAVPAWAVAVASMVLLTGLNLVAVRLFGELEFWFAMIKIVTIVGFIVLGVLAIVGLIPGVPAPGLANLTGNGGFFPNGVGQVALAGLVVVFSYFGTEVVTVAAGEAQHPATSLRKAMRSVVARILIFYIGSIAVIVTVLPWNSEAVEGSPFAAVLAHLGISGGAGFIQFAILTAILSNMSAGLFSASRMVFAMAEKGQAPAGLMRTSKRGVPRRAVLVASTGGFVIAAANYVLPTDAVFTFLLNSIGATGLVVYAAISLTQMRSRRRMSPSEVAALQVRMWGHPMVGAIVLAALCVVFFGLLFSADNRESTITSIIVTVIACAIGVVHQRRRRAEGEDARPVAADPAAPGVEPAVGQGRHV